MSRSWGEVQGFGPGAQLFEEPRVFDPREDMAMAGSPRGDYHGSYSRLLHLRREGLEGGLKARIVDVAGQDVAVDLDGEAPPPSGRGDD